MSDAAAAAPAPAAPAAAPSGGGMPGDPGKMLPPSDFDAAMRDMDFAMPREPANLARLNDPSLRPSPPPDQSVDPNVAERSQRAELERDDSVQAQVLDSNEQKAYEEWKTRRASPTLHEEDMEKLISVPWREGETRDVTVAEAKRGYMRQVDYTRGTQEAAAVKQQADTTLQNVNRFLNDLGSPQGMRQRLESLGHGEVLEKVAEEIYAERLADERKLYALKKRGASDQEVAEMRQVIEERRHLAAWKRRNEMQQVANQNNYQQQQQQAQQQAQQEQLRNQIAQLRPAAFKAVGIPNDALHEGAFGDQFIAILNSPRARQMELRDIVTEAAQATKQFVEDRIYAHRAAQEESQRAAAAAASTNPQPLAPGRLAGPPPMPSNGVSPARPKNLGLKDFDAEMARLSR
jgi:hypothetical protein